MTSQLLAQLTIDGKPVYDPLEGKITGVGGLVNLIMSIVFPTALFLVFIYLIMAGIELGRGMGSPDSMKKAKAKITNAIVGFILLAVSYWGAQLAVRIFWGS